VTHPVNGLDEIVHQRVRLGILAIAQEAKTVDFGFLQTTLDLTAGNLSHNLTVLEGAGLVRIQKGYEGKRPRTRVTITPAGRQALHSEIAHLKQLIAQFDSEPPDAAR
jgi:DNA-binding MarR family transcriptional regulator